MLVEELDILTECLLPYLRTIIHPECKTSEIQAIDEVTEFPTFITVCRYGFCNDGVACICYKIVKVSSAEYL